MTTQALQPSLVAPSEEFYRRRLRTVILALLAVSTIFMLYFGQSQFQGFRSVYWIEAVVNTLLHPLSLLVIWWCLRSANARISVGFALGYAANAVWSILRSVFDPAIGLQGPLGILFYRAIVFALYIAVLGLAVRLIQTEKSRRELALVGIPIGLLYAPVAAAIAKPAMEILKFIHGGY